MVVTRCNYNQFLEHDAVADSVHSKVHLLQFILRFNVTLATVIFSPSLSSRYYYDITIKENSLLIHT